MRKKAMLKCLQYFDTIPYINYGGCLFAAYYCFKYLQKLGLDKYVSIVQLNNWDDSNIKNNISCFKNNSHDFCPDSHFAICLGGKRFYDSTGIINKNEYQYYSIIPKESIENFCSTLLDSKNARKWNPSFNRENVSIMKNFVENCTYDEE